MAQVVAMHEGAGLLPPRGWSGLCDISWQRPKAAVPLKRAAHGMRMVAAVPPGRAFIGSRPWPTAIPPRRRGDWRSAPNLIQTADAFAREATGSSLTACGSGICSRWSRARTRSGAGGAVAGAAGRVTHQSADRAKTLRWMRANRPDVDWAMTDVEVFLAAMWDADRYRRPGISPDRRL